MPLDHQPQRRGSAIRRAFLLPATISGVWTPFARASSRTLRESEPWLRISSPLRATHWPLYSRPCALSHSCSGIRPEFAPGAGASVIVNRTCWLSRSDKGSSGRKCPSSNMASACWVTISFYRDKLGSSSEVTDRAPGGSRYSERGPISLILQLLTASASRLAPRRPFPIFRLNGTWVLNTLRIEAKFTV